MKRLVVGVALGLTAFTALVVATKPTVRTEGKTPLFWATDKNPLRDEQIALFNQQNPTIQLFLDPNNGAREKIIVQSKAGVGPDVFDYWGWSNFQAYVKSGIAYDLTDDLAKAGINYQRDVWPLAQPWTVYEGRVYGVPANVGTDGVWFHKDLFDKAGVPYPKDGWTTDQLVETAKKLTVRDASGRIVQYGMLVDTVGMFLHLLPSFGGDFWNENGTQCTLDSPEALQALQYVYDLTYKHRVAPTPQEESAITSGGGWGGGAGPMAYFRRKIGAMALGGRWWLAQLRGDIRDRGFELGAVPPPVAKYPRFGSGGTRAVMVNAASPRRDEAVKFAIFLLQEDYNLLLNEQADALSGIKKFAYTDVYAKNPRDPGQDFHVPFRDSLERGVMLRTTPYLPQSEVELYLYRQIDLVKLGQKSPAEGLRTATRDIMNALRRNIDRNPQLKAQYNAAVGSKP